MPVLAGVDIRWWRRYESLVKGIGKFNHMLEFLDKISEIPPPIRLLRVANELNIDNKMLWRYMAWLKKNNIIIRAKYSYSAMGLGVIAFLVDPPDNEVPNQHWLASVVLTSDGLLLTYRYPYIHGPDFIVKPVFKWARKVLWYGVYEERLLPHPKLSKYWIDSNTGFAEPATALEIAIELSGNGGRVYWKKRTRPRDLLDLFILAILEKDATINYTQMSDILRQKRIAYPKKKVNIHVNHLIDDGILIGTQHLSLSPTPNILNYVARFGSWNDLYDFISMFAKYLYAVFICVAPERYEVLTSIRAPLEYAPIYSKIINDTFNGEVIRSIHFSVPNILRAFTIPYRNFDPFNLEWSKNPADIDKWLIERGYYT